MNRGTYGNGVVETTGYNNRLQVSSIADAKSGTAFFSKTYSYLDGSGHNNGNILTITDTLNAAKTQTFTYDSVNRVLTGAQADNAFNLTYTYDPWGNMRESGTSTFQPLFDITNRMVPSAGCSPNPTPYCYDGAGDLLMDNHNHVYVYDGEARIKTVDTTAAAYTYNALGNRVRKDVGSTSTEYFFFAGNVIAELNPAIGAWTDYIGYGRRIAKDTSNNGTGTQYYHADHLGSARVMTDSAGTIISNCTYNPFGEEVGCSPDNASNHYRFAGKERDNESDLDDFGARYFSSSMGRWATPDWDARPVSVPYANFGDPQSLNLYLYVRNDPVSQADADGHITNDGNESCLTSFSCYSSYQEHIKDNQPSGWMTVISSFDAEPDGSSSQTKAPAHPKRSINKMKKQFYRRYGKRFNSAITKVFAKDASKVGTQTLANAPKVDVSKTSAEIAKMQGKSGEYAGTNRPDLSRYPSEIPYAKNGTVFIAKEDWESDSPNADLEIFKTFAHETANLLDVQVNGMRGHEENYGDPKNTFDVDTGQKVEDTMWPPPATHQ
jgi:RHS repeat-associated protein